VSQPEPINLLTRREAVARMALLFGGTLVGAQVFLRGETVAGKATAAGFAAADLALMDEIGDTIMPATDTPGAKAVGIGAFMALMVNDCYDDAHQAIFTDGLVQLEAACRQQSGKSFMAASPAERTALLNSLDAAARGQKAPVHYFRLMKELTLLGYFTSEIGCTQALRHIETPGRFDGNVPYKKGDRAWFTPPNSHVMRS
jgi:Gluconate 2-dehydrogenase subunit 3